MFDDGPQASTARQPTPLTLKFPPGIPGAAPGRKALLRTEGKRSVYETPGSAAGARRPLASTAHASGTEPLRAATR